MWLAEEVVRGRCFKLIRQVAIVLVVHHRLQITLRLISTRSPASTDRDGRLVRSTLLRACTTGSSYPLEHKCAGGLLRHEIDDIQTRFHKRCNQTIVAVLFVIGGKFYLR